MKVDLFRDPATDSELLVYNDAEGFIRTVYLNPVGTLVAVSPEAIKHMVRERVPFETYAAAELNQLAPAQE